MKMKNVVFHYRLVLSVFCLFTVVSHTHGQTHFRTTTKLQNTTATSISKKFAGSSSSGDLIIVHVDWDNQAINVSSVTDDKGNTYARISGPTNWNGAQNRAELWYSYNITGGGSPITITATLSGAPTSYSQIYMSEYSGIATLNPLDQFSVATGNAAAVSSGAKTTTQANELVYGVAVGSTGTMSTGAGFTSRSSANNNIVEDRNPTVIGTYDAAFSSTGGNWIAQMATFRTTNVILPVSLGSFTGQCNNGNIHLAWSTEMESNNDYFTVERSDDGMVWDSIGNVKGPGNSSEKHTYTFEAGESKKDISYFRLKQTDFDGNSQYYKTIRLEGCQTAGSSIHLYPNPSNGTALNGNIRLNSGESCSIEIFNGFGKLVSRQITTKPEFEIHFRQTLPNGIYYVRLTASGQSTVKCIQVSH